MLRSTFVKFLMSILKRQVNSLLNFESFFIFMRNNSSVNFKLMHILFWIKGSHQSPNIETFKCSGEILPYFSCHFPNHKSVFSSDFASIFNVVKDNASVIFQVKHYILCMKETKQSENFENFECSGQNSCHF